MPAADADARSVVVVGDVLNAAGGAGLVGRRLGRLQPPLQVVAVDTFKQTTHRSLR